jgi:hypothetical protein
MFLLEKSDKFLVKPSLHDDTTKVSHARIRHRAQFALD